MTSSGNIEQIHDLMREALMEEGFVSRLAKRAADPHDAGGLATRAHASAETALVLIDRVVELVGAGREGNSEALARARLAVALKLVAESFDAIRRATKRVDAIQLEQIVAAARRQVEPVRTMCNLLLAKMQAAGELDEYCQEQAFDDMLALCVLALDEARLTRMLVGELIW